MLWLVGVLCLAATARAAETCMSDLTGGKFTITASSATPGNPASGVFTSGWCASSNANDQWIEIEFPSALGFKGLVVGPKDDPPTSFPKDVLVQYVPIGDTTLRDPVQGGLVIRVVNATVATWTSSAGIATLKLRFFLRDYQTAPCLKIGLKGCPLNELCQTCVEGLCVQENNCQCNQGFTGTGCDKKVCSPAPLGLADGSLSTDKVTVSSQAVGHTKEDITFADGKSGWCPAATDKSPWVQVKLDKPMLVGVLKFKYADRIEPDDNMFMRSFDLLYVAPQDSSRMVRTFHENIPSLNGSHYISVSLDPPVSTDTIVIKARTSEIRACFKLELEGCDPENLCSTDYCMNGGQCIGADTCSCQKGWLGVRCDQKNADIQVLNTTFLQIVQNILITSSFNFTVTGHVTLTTEGNVPAVFLNGTNSFIQVNPASLAIDCLKDINKCTSGFTYAIDVKFNKLVDNTYILSSGGDLPDHHGIALFYSQQQLTYIVSTTTFKWTLRVPYVPVLNTWQHIEITWNKNLGIELHLDGYLLGTVGRPDGVNAPHSASLCIGCSHGLVQVDISMIIKEFHTWTTDRTELVNAGLKPSAPPATATPAPVTESTTALPSVTTPNKGYQEFNLTFVSIVGNLLITPAFNFTLHANPKLELQPNGHTAIVLDCSKQQYIELPDHGIPCLENMNDCSKGFTFKLEVEFTSIDPIEKTYILSSGGDVETASGMAIYLHSNQLIFGVKQGIGHWSGRYSMTGIIKTQVWYKYEISWSATKGISVVIDGVEVINDNDPTPSPTIPKTNPVLIGKTAGSNYTSCMKVRDLFTWTIHREVLVDSGILQSASTIQQSSTTLTPASTTAKATPTSTIRTTTKARDPLVPYDLTFTYKQNNIIYTQENSFLFQSHGNPTVSSFFNMKLLTMHGATGDYLQLKNTGEQCIDIFNNCNNGFTVEIGLTFLTIDSTQRTFIFSNSGENQGQVGMFLYYLGHTIWFGYGDGNRLWKTSLEYELISGPYYTIILSWSQSTGMVLYIDYYQVKRSDAYTAMPIASVPGAFSVGHTYNGITNSSMNIGSIKIWKTSSETLINNNVITTLTTTPKTTESSTRTTKALTTIPGLNILGTASYNLSFISITNNQLITPLYTFITIGHPILRTLDSGKNVLQLNQTKGEYVRMSNKSIPCLNDLTNCSHGFTFQISVNFELIDYTKKIYIITNSIDSHGDGTFYLYYKNHNFYFGTVVGQLLWSTEIHFEITQNIFQNLELSWSRNSGIQLYVNGTLLKSSNETTTVDTTPAKESHITIGKAEGNISYTVLLITDMHFWSLSRQSLQTWHSFSTTKFVSLTTESSVSSSTVTSQPTTSHINMTTAGTQLSTAMNLSSTTVLATYVTTDNKGTAHVSTETGTKLPTYTSTSHIIAHTQKSSPATSSSVSTTSDVSHTRSTTEAITTGQPIEYVKPYNLSFVNITGNTLFTQSYTFTIHGTISLVVLTMREKAIQINGSKGEYLELKNKSLPCISDFTNCTKGVTVKLDVQFITVNHLQKVFILTSNGNTETGYGLYLYYYNYTMYFAYTFKSIQWSGNVKFEIVTGKRYAFELTWSKTLGVALYVNGSLVKSSNISVGITATTVPVSLLIGKNTGVNVTFLISNILIFPAGRDMYYTSSATTHYMSSTTEMATTPIYNYSRSVSSGIETSTPVMLTETPGKSESTTLKATTTYNKGTEHASTETATKLPTYTSTIHITAHTQKSSSVTLSSASKTSDASYTRSTTESVTTGQPIDYVKPYNLSFVNITGNTLFTQSYTFTIHGTISLVVLTMREKAIQINGSKGEYLELKNQSLPCISDFTNCTKGVTVKLDVQFITFNHLQKVFILTSNGNTESGHGLYLYYYNYTMYFAYTFKSIQWSGHAQFEIGTGKWYAFELTWSKTHGVALYVNGFLVKSSNVSIGITAITVPVSLLIGKNTGVNVTFLISNILIFPAGRDMYYTSSATIQHMSTTPEMATTPIYNYSRSVSSGIETSTPVMLTETHGKSESTTFKATTTYNKGTEHASTETATKLPTYTSTSHITAHTQKSSSVTLSSASKTSDASYTRSTTESITTGQPIDYVKPYNLSFVNITGNTLFTQSYTFTIHGTITLLVLTMREKAIQINGSKGEYLELKNQSLPCISDFTNCTKGVTVKLDVQFITFNHLQKVFILTSNGNTDSGHGLYLYYYNYTMFFAYTFKSIMWSGHAQFEIGTGKWYTFELTWSKTLGVALYVNGSLIKSSNVSTVITATTVPVRLLIGKNTGVNVTFLISNILIFPAGRDMFYNSSATIQYMSTTPEMATTPIYNTSTNSIESTFHSATMKTAISTSHTTVTNAPEVITTPRSKETTPQTRSSSIHNNITTIPYSSSTTVDHVTPTTTNIPSAGTQNNWETTNMKNVTKTTSQQLGTTVYLPNASTTTETNTDSVRSTGTHTNKEGTLSTGHVHTTSIQTTPKSLNEASTPDSSAETSIITEASTNSGPTTRKVTDTITSTVKSTSTLDNKLETTFHSTQATTDVSQISNMQTTVQPSVTTMKLNVPTETSATTETATDLAHLTTKLNDNKTEATTQGLTSNTGEVATTTVETASVRSTESTHKTSESRNNTIPFKITTTSSYSATRQVFSTNHNIYMSQSSTTTQGPVSYETYNLGFVNITQNLIFTHTFTIQTHGILVLEKVLTGETAVKLNGTQGQYLEVKKQNISCIDTVDNCTNGFTVQVKVNFLSMNISQKNYIIVSSGEITGSTGLYLYYQNNTFHFGTIFQNKLWSTSVQFNVTENTWYSYELTWSIHNGIGLYIDGVLIKATQIYTNSSTSFPSSPGSMLIGKALGASYTASMLVTGLQFWSASHQILYPTSEKTTEPSTLAPTTTTHAPTTTTLAPTTTTLAPTTTTQAQTTTAKPTTTPVPTTTLPPIPTFTWNFTQTTGVNVTIHGNVPTKDGGLSFTNSTQFIDFGKNNLVCLINPASCTTGLTIQFVIHFTRIEENTYLLTSGGQLPDGIGLAVIYRFNNFQFVLSTATQSWFAIVHRKEVLPKRPHTITISWNVTVGLEVFINNVLIDANKNPTTHVTTNVSMNTVYFGKQTSVVTTTTHTKVDFVLQSIVVWYATLDILVDRGYCKPPTRPTHPPPTQPTTVKPTTTKAPATTMAATTPKPTTREPATTQRATLTSLATKSTTLGQCPVGCVSIASTVQTPPATRTQQPSAPTTQKPSTAKPTAAPTTQKPTTAKPTAAPTTQKPSTAKPTNPITPPPPITATPSIRPTTERPPPNYNTKPSLEPIIGNDTKAYLSCSFTATGRDVVFTVRLIVDGQLVDQKTSPGQNTFVLFAVSTIEMLLFKAQIQCTVSAKYVGGTYTTIWFNSNLVVPHFTVTPGRIIVVEGKKSEFVTVTSTCPPQFYCCKGCRGECQVHIVGSFNFNHRKQQKCNNNYIAQSLIVSNKPPNYNSPICGFPLTITNWYQQNKIEIKATIDNRRDGDHTNGMVVQAHVYNQPAHAQITVKPSVTFIITTVQVTAKDNDACATCKSVNDPHLRTFDGWNFNNMREGVFVLFRHPTLPFEVRALYRKCNKRGSATCNCAVAVQSGDDVITVTGCQGTDGGHPGQGHGIGLIMQQLFGGHGHAHGHDQHLAKTPMTIQIYKNGDFTPGTIIRRFGCGQKYEIELPTGMVITVQQSYKPFINIFIKGSSSDRGYAQGLCGNFDGSRHNDIKHNTNTYIDQWKGEYENFFYGVGVSSQHLIQTYCSCIQGKDKICLAGFGAMRCVETRYDITTSLVKQAKTPILTRHKRQALAEPTPTLPVNIPTDEIPMTEEKARQRCENEILNNAVTETCTPVLTSNMTDHIDNCVHDYNATLSFEWAKDALRDIAAECIDNINDYRAANESGNTNVTDEINIPDDLDIDQILNKSCIDDCGAHGSCAEGVCACDEGYSGVTCNISKTTVPTISIVPFLCDMAHTSDCQGAMVYGENFVDTPDLTCHYQFAEVHDTIVPSSGQTGQVKATYISINQVMCQLPRPQSALLTVSNDGKEPSTNQSAHVVFNSVCHACTVDDQTFKASCFRKENNCIIGGVCYASGDTRNGDICQVCRPAANGTVWSHSLETICQEKPQAIEKEVENQNQKKITIALAVACGVLAAVIVIGAICLCRKSGSSKKSKSEFGAYEVSPVPNLHRNEFKSVDNPVYLSDKM